MAARRFIQVLKNWAKGNTCPPRKPERRWQVYGLLVLTTLLLPHSTETLAAEDMEQEPVRWLPARLQDSLQPYLNAIIRHADTRLPCTTILEAKYSDGSSESNPKFIVTCESDEFGSTNLVYWKRDVEERFANVAYEAKPSVTASELNLDEVDLAYNATEQQTMIESCKETFALQFADKLPRLGEPKIQRRLRANTLLAIYLNYPRYTAPDSRAYTATCLIKPDQAPKLDVFSR